MILGFVILWFRCTVSLPRYAAAGSWRTPHSILVCEDATVRSLWPSAVFPAAIAVVPGVPASALASIRDGSRHLVMLA